MRESGAACVLVDVADHVLERVAGVGVVEAFGEPVDEDAGVRVVEFDFRVGAVGVRDGEEDVAVGGVW